MGLVNTSLIGFQTILFGAHLSGAGLKIWMPNVWFTPSVLREKIEVVTSGKKKKKLKKRSSCDFQLLVTALDVGFMVRLFLGLPYLFQCELFLDV